MFNVRGFELKLSMTVCSYRGWKEGENIAHYHNVMLMNTMGTWAGSLDMRFRVFVYTQSGWVKNRHYKAKAKGMGNIIDNNCTTL